MARCRSDKFFYPTVKKITGKDNEEGCTASNELSVMSIIEEVPPFGNTIGDKGIPCQISENVAGEKCRNPRNSILDGGHNIS